jgi:hypothetical protein
MLHIYTSPWELENVLNSRIRSFLHSYGYLNAVVSRDFDADDVPDVMVWSRLIGPGAEMSEGFQRNTLQVSVTCESTPEKDGRELSSEISTLLVAWFNSRDALGLPITNIEAGSSPYITNGLDTFERPAYTFSLSVYQTTTKINV